MWTWVRRFLGRSSSLMWNTSRRKPNSGSVKVGGSVRYRSGSAPRWALDGGNGSVVSVYGMSENENELVYWMSAVMGALVKGRRDEAERYMYYVTKDIDRFRADQER